MYKNVMGVHYNKVKSQHFMLVVDFYFFLSFKNINVSQKNSNFKLKPSLFVQDLLVMHTVMISTLYRTNLILYLAG